MEWRRVGGFVRGGARDTVSIANKIVDVAIFGDLANIKRGYVKKKDVRYTHVHVEDDVFVFGTRTGVDKHGHLLLKRTPNKKKTEKYLQTKLQSIDISELSCNTLVKISCILAADNPSLYTTGVLRYV